jgi:hypothetical protein
MVTRALAVRFPLQLHLALAALILSACSPGTAPPDVVNVDGGGGDAGTSADAPVTANNVSGTRLKARWVTSADGLKTFQGWKDSARGEDCGWNFTGDGVLRCLPYTNLTDYGDVFSDAACTQAAVLAYTATCVTYSTIRKVDSTVCPATTRFFARGAQVSAAVYYRKSSGGTCTSYAISADQQLWRVGAELGPGSFTGGTVSAVQGTGTVGYRRIDAEDGAKAFRVLEDLASSKHCYTGVASDLQYRCLPNDVAGLGSQYSDGSCTQLVAYTSANACPKPPYASAFDSTTCPATVSVYSTGASLSNLYDRSSGSCMAATPWGGYSYYSLGAEVPASSFPIATPRDGQSFGRLTQRLFEYGPQLRLQRDIYDSSLGRQCYATTAGDGQLRCLPNEDAAVDAYFADAACTQPVAIQYSATGGCPPRWAARYNEAECPQRVYAYRLGAQFTGQLYEKPAGGVCVTRASSPNARYWRVTGEELPANLVPLTLLIDP